MRTEHRFEGRPISTVFNFRTRADIRSDQQKNELKAIADHLEVLRSTSPFHPSMSHETAEELREALALAEAALRRASAEIQICD